MVGTTLHMLLGRRMGQFPDRRLIKSRSSLNLLTDWSPHRISLARQSFHILFHIPIATTHITCIEARGASGSVSKFARTCP